MKNLLTFDVEDWYQGLDVSIDRWSSFEKRLSIGLDFILNALAEHGTSATFFVLGVTAVEHSDWVRRIAAAGHEVGTHGWSHTPIYRQSRKQFCAELSRSIETLQELVGRQVNGHRAALFSITARSWWVFDELAQAGLRYDSSIFPVYNYRYGIPSAERFPHPVPLCAPDQPAFWEFPIATLRLGGLNVPVGGGFYARFWCYEFLHWAIKHLNAQGQPALFYFHPWEFDADQPRLWREARWLARATHYHRLAGARKTLLRLLSHFEWMPVEAFTPRPLLE